LPPYVPDVNGCSYTLPDDVITKVRLSYSAGRYRLEWLLPDRTMEVPDNLNVFERMKKFIKHGMQTPHRVITLTHEARGAFVSFQTMYNIKVKQSRDRNDVDGGAEYGIAPWKLGQLSAALLLWDIMWDVKVPMFKEEKWEVDVVHVRRAYTLMHILDSVRECFRTNRIREDELAAGIDESKGAVLGADHDHPDCQKVEGTTGTDIARRMLFKSVPTENKGEYKCHTMKTFQMFTPKEKTKIGKMTVFIFREIAKVCPPVLGTFNVAQDSLIWHIPSDPSDEWTNALKQFANTKAQPLRDMLKTVGMRAGGPRRGRSEQAATASD